MLFSPPQLMKMKTSIHIRRYRPILKNFVVRFYAAEQGLNTSVLMA